MVPRENWRRTVKLRGHSAAEEAAAERETTVRRRRRVREETDIGTDFRVLGIMGIDRESWR